MAHTLDPLRIGASVRNLKTNRTESVVISNQDKSVTIGVSGERTSEYAPVLFAAPQLLEACKALTNEDRLIGFCRLAAQYPGEPPLTLLEMSFPELFAAIAAAEPAEPVLNN